MQLDNLSFACTFSTRCKSAQPHGKVFGSFDLALNYSRLFAFIRG